MITPNSNPVANPNGNSKRNPQGNFEKESAQPKYVDKHEIFQKTVTETRPLKYFGRVSLAAIFSGAAVAVVVQMMFSLLGISFSAGMIEPQTQANPMNGVGLTLGLWMAAGALIAFFVGGWIAGRMAGAPRKIESGLHGVISWAVVTLVLVWTMTGAVGGIVSTTTQTLGSAVQAAGQGIGSLVASNNVKLPDVSAEQAKSSALTFLGEVGISKDIVLRYMSNSGKKLKAAGVQAAENPDQAYDTIVTALGNVAQRGVDIAQKNVNSEDAVRLLQEKAGISQDKAKSIVQQWEQKIQSTDYSALMSRAGDKIQNSLEAAGGKVASGVSSAAGWGFLSLLIGLIAAALGGILGAHKPSMIETSSREFSEKLAHEV